MFCRLQVLRIIDPNKAYAEIESCERFGSSFASFTYHRCEPNFDTRAIFSRVVLNFQWQTTDKDEFVGSCRANATVSDPKILTDCSTSTTTLMVLKYFTFIVASWNSRFFTFNKSRHFVLRLRVSDEWQSRKNFDFQTLSCSRLELLRDLNERKAETVAAISRFSSHTIVSNFVFVSV